MFAFHLIPLDAFGVHFIEKIPHTSTENGLRVARAHHQSIYLSIYLANLADWLAVVSCWYFHFNYF